MRRVALLAALALAACSEAPSGRPAATSAGVAPAEPAPAAPDSLPPPAPPTGDAADGVTQTHVIHPSLPPHRITLVVAAEGGEVRALRVRAVGAPEAHELPVSESAVGPHFRPGDRLLVGDLDFDGYADLGFVTTTGATGNVQADYWRFDPAPRRFVAVGTHPVFTVDSAGRQLRAHQKGGHAGLLFTHETYRWMDGRPVVVRVEAQDTDTSGEGYVRTVHELRDGRMTEVERRALTRDEAVAEADHQAPARDF